MTSRLYNYGYRDYNPKLARFTTKDPISLGYDGNKDGKYESTNSADNPAVLLYAGGD